VDSNEPDQTMRVDKSIAGADALAIVEVRGTPAIGWAQRLGDARRWRDERAGQLARSRETDASQATALSFERWVTIVAAIRRLADAYNAGACRVVLNVVEQSEQPTVTVAAGGEGTPYLTATLEDTFICMRARDALGVPHATDFQLRSDRDDDATAAYLLQNWMQHL
jgi:hypothetical protein